MNKIEDDGTLPANPFAFPSSEGAITDRGMTLRDWFAGQALAGYLASYGPDGNPANNADLVARRTYILADAMLRARQS